MKMLDEIRVVKNPLISDEEQLAEIEFSEAQEAFYKASCLCHDTERQDTMEQLTECEVRLLNAFCRGEDNPILLKAWAAYRRRLLFHHRKES